jgi:site-specific recombinase XerD
MSKRRPATDPGSAHLELIAGVRVLHPEDTVVNAMLSGWRKQQIGGRQSTPKWVEAKVKCVREFIDFAGAYPWAWTSQMMDDWSVELVLTKRRAKTTVRGKQGSIRQFCHYITSPHYDWPTVCEARFGTHPVQICFEWNTSAHLVEYEGDAGRRAFTRKEVQAFLDCADARVEKCRNSRRKGAAAAYRDATMFKTMYGWGLRITECCRLDVADLYRNPKAPVLGRCGFIHVRYGKSSKGSPPKRRTVPTLMPWAAEALLDYVDNIRPLFNPDHTHALWPTERHSRIKPRTLTESFDEIRTEAGLDKKLTPHCFRHSFITHLTEDGVDPKFIQEIAGHRFGSTTSLYTHISSEHMNRMLQIALKRMHDPSETEAP